MFIETDTFPIVRMHYDRAGASGDEAGWKSFETLLGQPRPFVLIGLNASKQAHDQTPEERKHVALWIKRHREPLRRLVKAMVYVEPQSAKRFIAKAQAIVLGKAWGFPMIVAASEVEALAIAGRVLGGEAAATLAQQSDA